MLTRLRTVLAVAMLTVGTYAVAVESSGSHPDTYVVRKGDTLWDISARFLKKPWLWPEIWQANPQVANPHLIYPGDVLSLAYLDRVGVQPGPRQEAPIGAIPLSEIEPFLKDLRVTDAFEHLPYVVGFEDNRLRGSAGQAAYIKGLDAAQPGQRYAVVRPTVSYALPRHSRDLEAHGRPLVGDGNLWKQYVAPTARNEFLGYELAQVNVGTVTRLPAGEVTVATLQLEDSGHEVRAGDRLIPVEAQPYDLQFFPHPPKQQLDYGRARIIGVADGLIYGGPRDVVALSVGAREGVDNGTVFSIWRVGSEVADRVKYGTNRSPDLFSQSQTVRLPDEFAGHVMVFRTFDKVSYGLVMDSIKPSRVGFELKHPDAPY